MLSFFVTGNPMNTAIAKLKPYLSKHSVKLNTFQPLRVSKHYQVDEQKINKVSVIRVRYLKSKRPDWYFKVHRRNADLLFLTLNNKGQVVVLDDKSNIYLYDCEFQVCLAHQQFNSRDDINIQCNEDYLYILTDCEIYAEGEEPKDYSPRTNTLYQFDYHNFVIKHQVRVDDDYELFPNTLGKDEQLGYWLNKDKLYLYCSDYAHAKRDHSGLASVDFKRSKRQGLVSEGCFKTQHKFSTYRKPPIFISVQYGIGIRPNYLNPNFIKPSTAINSVYSEVKSRNEEYIPYNIEIFDINSGNNITSLEVRQFTQAELEEKKTGLVLELLKSGEVFKEYDMLMERANPEASNTIPDFPARQVSKTFDRFYNELRNVTFYPNLMKDVIANLGIAKKSIGFILEFKNDVLLNVEVSSSNIKIIPLSSSQVDCFNESSSSLLEQDAQDKESNPPFIPAEKLISNIIEIPQWSLASAKFALAQYLVLVQTDVKALIVDYEINVYFHIGYNAKTKHYSEKHDDKHFFEKLSEFGEDIAPELVELINWFCEYPDSETLYHDCETTFLAYAMKHLLSLGDQYHPLYLRYLANVDMDHDVINTEMCGDILSGDQWSDNKLKFIIAMTYLGGQHLYSELFDCWPGALEEYVTKHYDTASLAALLEKAYLHDPEHIDEILDEYHSQAEQNNRLIDAFFIQQQKHASSESLTELE